MIEIFNWLCFDTLYMPQLLDLPPIEPRTGGDVKNRFHSAGQDSMVKQKQYFETENINGMIITH